LESRRSAAVPQPRSRKRGGDREGEREDGATARGIWSGSLTFGLVSVPIELFAAERHAGARLRMLGPAGTPLSRRYVCSEEERPLEPDEIARGYAVAKDEYVIVTDEELEALAPRRSRDIELTRFVDRDALDPSYFERAWFLAPASEQTKAYRLLAELMESTGRAAIATFVMREKAYWVAILSDGGLLRAEALRSGDELRSAADVGIAKAKRAEPARVRKMAKALAALEKPQLDPRELADDAPEAILELARKKRARGQDVVEAPDAGEPAEEAGADVIDLMALLKQRLRGGAAARKPAARKPAARAKPARRKRS
jgi:DNA end-binding protein Ku